MYGPADTTHIFIRIVIRSLILSDGRTTAFGVSPLRVTILLAAYLLGFCAPAVAEECAPPRLENTVTMEPLGEHGRVGVSIFLNGVEKSFFSIPAAAMKIIFPAQWPGN